MSAPYSFGYSVAIRADTVVVGTHFDDNLSTGSAHIFTRDANGVWTQQAKLLSNDAKHLYSAGFFVDSIALTGNNTALIGTDFDDDNGDNSGAAYIFKLSQ